jgi:hypothetical protein
MIDAQVTDLLAESAGASRSRPGKPRRRASRAAPDRLHRAMEAENRALKAFLREHLYRTSRCCA